MAGDAESNQDRPRRILVLDDDRLLLATVSRLLSKLDIESDTCSGADDAIRQYREAIENNRPYDAVIMDLNIPGDIDSLEIIDRILKINPESRIIVTSGYTDDPVMEDYRKYRLAGRIGKPFKVEDLKRVLSEIWAIELI